MSTLNRTGLKVSIYKAGTEPPNAEARWSGYIGKGSTAKFMLGQEDYVVLKFSTNELVKFQYGDYIYLNEFLQDAEGLASDLAMTFGKRGDYYVWDSKIRKLLGDKYQLVDAYMPTYNENTRGYDYTLRLDAYYYEWKHFMMMRPVLGNSSIVRKETDFSLTDSIENHIYLLLLNLKACGLTDFDDEQMSACVHFSPTHLKYISVDTSNAKEEHVETGDGTYYYFDNDSKYLQYHNTTILDAVKSIAGEWEVDWWVKDNEIHFGKLERLVTQQNPAKKIELGKQAKSITGNKSGGNFFTRLYAFGSTRNIAKTYRQNLVFQISADDDLANKEITDKLRPLRAEMFGSTVTKESKIYDRYTDGQSYQLEIHELTQNSSVRYVNGEVTDDGVEIGVMGTATRLPLFTSTMPLIAASNLYAYVDFSAAQLSIRMLVRNPGATVDLSLLTASVIVTYRDGEVKTYACDVEGTYLHDVNNEEGVLNFSLHQLEVTFGESESAIYLKNISSIDLAVLLPETAAATSYQYTSLAKVGDVNLSSFYKKIQTFAQFGNSRKAITINPNCLPYDDPASTKVVYDELPPIGYNPYFVGAKYTVEGLIQGKIPSSYYTEPDSNALVNSIGEKRLMLPETANPTYGYGGNGYLDLQLQSGTLADSEIIEGVYVDDEVFPHREDTITAIRLHEYEEEETDAVTGLPLKKLWKAYQFKRNNEDFSADYILKTGEGLHATFSSGKLNGMTFEVVWNPTHAFETAQPELLPDGTRNPDACWWEIIRNEDYGVAIPNETLYPDTADTFVLWGYDSSYLGTTPTTNAETELLRRARAYLQKLIHNDGTYDVTFLNAWLRETGAWFSLGEYMEFATPNYFDETRQERIIGYNICLDIPEDNPTVTCGENPRYSRLQSIEDKATKTTGKQTTKEAASKTVTTDNARIDRLAAEIGDIDTLLERI